MRRVRFLSRRIALAVLTLWGVVTLMFFMFQALPGNAALSMFGVRTSGAEIAEINHKYGLDRPIWSQYFSYLDRTVHGNLGTSIIYSRPASQVIGSALPTTLELALYAVVMTTALTLLLAIAAAMRRDTVIDYVIRTVPVVGLGLPTFWTGTMLLLVFALKLRLFPAGGLEPGFTGHLESLFLPALSLTVLFIAVLVRSLRASLLEVLDSDHVLTARAKGIVGVRLVFSHVLPSAVIPTATLLGLIFAGLLGGALIVETVFALPGVGSLLVEGFRDHDFSLVQGITLIAAAAIVAMNILIDLLYSILDPRVGLL